MYFILVKISSTPDHKHNQKLKAMTKN